MGQEEMPEREATYNPQASPPSPINVLHPTVLHPILNLTLPPHPTATSTPSIPIPRPSSLLPPHSISYLPPLQPCLPPSHSTYPHLNSPIFHLHPPLLLFPFPSFPTPPPLPSPTLLPHPQLCPTKFCPLLDHPTVVNRKNKFLPRGIPHFTILQLRKTNPHVSGDNTVE